MLKLLLSGACGKMGRVITDKVNEGNDGLKIICGVDIAADVMPYPVYSSFDSVAERPDVIIDFSSVNALDGVLKYALSEHIPVVLATTGYTQEQHRQIMKAAEVIPVFYTANMSLGVNLLSALSKKAAEVLGNDFDVEIIEKHHNQKLDAPSGTALMLAQAVNSAADDRYYYEYDRHSKRQKRNKNEIGIHSVRGGTIVGEHSVIFAGNDEIVTLTHTATSKTIFAVGALRAAKFIFEKPAGIYDMGSILSL